MPARNPRPCTRWPCNNDRPCPDHDRTDPDRERARNAERQASLEVYRSARWRKLRTAFLRAHPWCAGHPSPHQLPTPATDVDHVTPIEDGGDPWDWANLQALCSSCHGRKTADDVRRRKLAGGKGRSNPLGSDEQDRRGSRARIAGSPHGEVRGPVGSGQTPTRRRRRAP